MSPKKCQHPTSVGQKRPTSGEMSASFAPGFWPTSPIRHLRQGLFRHGVALVFTATAPNTPPPSHPFTLHHDSIAPHRPHRLIAASASCHHYESRRFRLVNVFGQWLLAPLPLRPDSPSPAPLPPTQTARGSAHPTAFMAAGPCRRLNYVAG